MKYIKYLWTLSLFIYLGLNLLAYIYFPDSGVMVLHATEASEAVIMSKSDFFYASMGTLLFVDIALVILGGGILHLPKSLILLPNKNFWLKTKENRALLLEKTKGWTKGLATLFNLLMLTTLGLIYGTQGHDMDAIRIEYSPIIISVLILVWIISIFPIFKKPTVTE
ncbi:hypothetical protein [Flammeovirga kamogawensis]|uniref:DUF1648 domain-containing protein n=1 Tax=Flammeovirga kamogawensis TaxID=373891 RepID=A0ABX8GXD3_9BACT|nr:hypothetical protein [Flammeovirga kamogawensis]MBB6460704.1 hypothetical protein [Flammeovirga kamogawensis]QWG08058.1 hypothetical protein KM029_03735 [Flammeovirga kamogawensis]TRX69864.1 hypothetical protein EO216_17675 [Flammeovirga kamogawensis]